MNKYHAQVTILQEYPKQALPPPKQWTTTTQTMENNKTTENQVSFEIEMTSTALDKSVKKKNNSFEEILKVPKLVNITNKRGEKSE